MRKNDSTYLPGLFPSCICLVILLSVLTACTSRIDIQTKDAPTRLVIYGYITTDTTSHYIKITRSSGYFSTAAPEGISGATVTITSGEEVITLTENANEKGLYETPANVYGIEGNTYHLAVSVDFDGDGVLETYQSSSYLPHKPEIDRIELKESEVFDDRIEVLFYGKLPDEAENYISFQVYRNHILVTDSLKDFSVIDDEYIDTKVINGAPCFYLDQEEEKTILTPGDFVTLRVNSLTKEYAEFIWNAQSEVYGSNPIFSGPPANIETNIVAKEPDNEIPVSGFFSAYSSVRGSTIYQ